jgi:hypothetical protein
MCAHVLVGLVCPNRRSEPEQLENLGNPTNYPVLVLHVLGPSRNLT